MFDENTGLSKWHLVIKQVIIIGWIAHELLMNLRKCKPVLILIGKNLHNSMCKLSYLVKTNRSWIRKAMRRRQTERYSMVSLKHFSRYVISMICLPFFLFASGANLPACLQSEVHQVRWEIQDRPSKMPNVSSDVLLRSRLSASQKLLMPSKR